MGKCFSVPVDKLQMEQVNNGDFLKVKLYAISTDENRNDSEFMLESFDSGIPTIINKPVLAYYNKKLGDVEEHNSRLELDSYGELYEDFQYEGAEKPVGLTPESAAIYTEHIDGKTWIVVDSALIWTAYNKQLVDLLMRQREKKVSVEVEILDSEEVDGIEKIYAWKWLGITILGKFPNGELVEEGIEGAHLTLKEFGESESFNKFRRKFSEVLKGQDGSILERYGISQKKNFMITQNQLHSIISGILSAYTYVDRDYTYRKYWIADFLRDQDVVIIQDDQEGRIYAVEYSIDGENVSLDINHRKPASTSYTFSQGHKEEVFLSKKEWGTGPALTVDKSKDSVSTKSWGEVNKTELRNNILKAKNYKSLVKSVYLLVEDGWENAPASKLKYPVMQISGNKVVYNAGGLLSAQQYGEKYDKAVAAKAKRLRKKLGLLDNEKEKREKMSKFTQLAYENGYIFVGTSNDKLMFVKDEMASDDKKDCMSLFECEKAKAENCDENFAWADELTVRDVHFDSDKNDDDDKEDDDGDSKKETQALKADLEKCKADLEKCKAEKMACEEELKTIRMKDMEKETEALMAAEDNGLDDEEKESLRKMRSDGKFSSIEDFERELAYRKYKKEAERSKGQSDKFASFSANSSVSGSGSPSKSIFDELN